MSKASPDVVVSAYFCADVMMELHRMLNNCLLKGHSDGQHALESTLLMRARLTVV